MSGIKQDSLFLGLTRQPMLFGVTYNYVFLNMFGTLIYFIASSDFKIVIFSVGFHAMSYMICLREPLLLDLFILKLSKCSKCRNKIYHGYKNSYDPF
jgi:type IV secretion system protein VirB3